MSDFADDAHRGATTEPGRTNGQALLRGLERALLDKRDAEKAADILKALAHAPGDTLAEKRRIAALRIAGNAGREFATSVVVGFLLFNGFGWIALAGYGLLALSAFGVTAWWLLRPEKSTGKPLPPKRGTGTP